MTEFLIDLASVAVIVACCIGVTVVVNVWWWRY